MKHNLLTIAILAIFSTPVHASFYVDDDAPQVTAAVPLPALPQAQTTSEINIDLIFAPKQSWITLLGKRKLKATLEEFRTADEITITTYKTFPASAWTQRLRGQSIKQWLVVNDVSASKITVVVDDTETVSQDDPSANTSYITLRQRKTLPSNASTQASPRYATLVRPEQIKPISAIYQPTTAREAPRELITDTVKLALVQKIVSMSQNKVVKPEDAMNMLAEILKMRDGTPSTIPALATPLAASIMAIDLPRTWTLDGTKPLRENVEDWSKIAKWEPPAWNSATSFKFTTSTLTGTYLDVLGQIAKAVPTLDFKANRTLRTLSVFDILNPK